jgi:hypothetical protein
MNHRDEIFGRRLPTLVSVLTLGLLSALSAPAFAQSASATLHGAVIANEQPVAGAKVVATNTQTGLSRTVQTDARGSYTLAGLPPGTYKVEATGPGGAMARLVTLQVGQVGTLDLGVAAVAQNLESVTVTATHIYESRTSEVATYITPQQIEMLPQNSRNFLAFADIVPGVQFVTSGDGSTSEIRGGAQAANGVNVFIDGVGQKNYVLRGGVSGQTLSRGNPFPQLGIAEYKVITSNYKAEFDQLSSAAIVAVTRSGTNEFESEAFYDKTSEKWREPDPIEKEQGEKAKSDQEQYGIAFGGPIIRDRMHFFVTYEGKRFETPENVVLGQGISSADAGPFAQYLGVVSAPFDEDLFFGKIDWSVADDHLLELTGKVRNESEIEALGDQNTESFASTKKNDETRIDLRYQFTGARFMNDAHLTYEDARFNPRPVTIAPGYRLAINDVDHIILNLGGGENYQDKGQKGWAIQDDLTFTEFEWLGGSHTVKTGVKYKWIEINAFEQQPYNPQFYYDVLNSLDVPFSVRFGATLPGFAGRNVTSKNKQLGIYLQDDWEVNSKLLLNLGLRWDYEETPSYLNFMTPADVIAGLNTQDPLAPAGQTYAQSLALGGVNVNDYISTGSNRHAFDSGIQPRVGFSYDLFEDQRHVIFGGAGRAYDRNVFDYIALEVSKGTFPAYSRSFNVPGHPCTPGVGDCLDWNPAYYDPANLAALVAANPQLGREINLIQNDIRTPYSDQFSLGMRNRVELWKHDWNTSLTLSYVRSEDGIVFLLGNRYPDGSFRGEVVNDVFVPHPEWTWGGQPFGTGIPGLGTLLIAKNGLETRAKSVLVQVEKPYAESSRWGVTLAYTYTDAEENRNDVASTDEHYIFDYPGVAGFGWHTSTGVPKHRFVATGIYEAPWDLMLSAKLTLQSPYEYSAVDCFDVPAGIADPGNHCFFNNFKADTTLGLRQLDLALAKTFRAWSGLGFSVRADVLNVFNYENVDTYDTYRGDTGGPNVSYGDPTGWRQPTRTFKLSFSVEWR